MALKLYFHPLSSFCQKVLVALYENGTPFEPHIVNLGDETSSAELRRLWPIGEFPVLRDEINDRTIPESSIIIEYLAQHYPGRAGAVLRRQGDALRDSPQECGGISRPADATPVLRPCGRGGAAVLRVLSEIARPCRTRTSTCQTVAQC